ncbi:unnamed protein product [Calicophoron daubneyi]|uniref:Macrophage erythroblast attacher n=1 Tax=Calicophoron daubneyi TaxID=300641 RepID=A0AAV2TZY5_CALDB
MVNDQRCAELSPIEHTVIKAGYELLNKRYRRNHRELEQEVSKFKEPFDKLESVSGIAEAIEMLDKVDSVVRGCKRKADYVYAEESRILQNCKRRIDHINQVWLLEKRPALPLGGADASNDEAASPDSDPNVAQSELQEQYTYLTRFQRHLADYLFSIGQPNAALQLAREKPELNDLCLTDVYKEAVTIESALCRGDTGPAHSWLQEAYYKLKKNENYFEFDLRVFEFYLLVRDGKRMEAIQHARKYMSSVKQPDDYRATKLGQAMILLAMRTPEELHTKAEQNNLTEKWIVKRAHEVLMDFYDFPDYSIFQLVVNAGISVIKTHQCYDTKTQKRDCAVCHPLVNQLAVNVPFARHDHSVLTCYQTGLLMNEDNPPMSLPNGYVYSQKGIAELTGSDGMITCPRSGERFSPSQVQRVFIL